MFQRRGVAVAVSRQFGPWRTGLVSLPLAFRLRGFVVPACHVVSFLHLLCCRVGNVRYLPIGVYFFILV